MPPLAVFGIESSGLSLVVDLLLLFVVVLYLSLIYWTYIDARRRIEDPMLVGCATAASIFFPFVGTIIYMVLRPPEYLEDVHERELEAQATEARLHEIEGTLCPHCDYRIEPDFVRCPSCLRKLKERCVNCSRPLDRAWTICPYCEADVPGLSAPRQKRRRAAAVREDETELAAAAPAPKSAAGRKRAAKETALSAETAVDAEPAIAAEPLSEVELDAQGASAVGDTTPRRRSTGRSPRPGGRARPTS